MMEPLAEIPLEKRVLRCRALGCADLLPTQRVKLAQKLYAEEGRAAHARRVAALRQGTQVPVRENLPNGQRGTAWNKVGAKLGVSGRTIRKEVEIWNAAQKDPRLSRLVRQMDARGVDGPWRQLQVIEAGMPVSEYDGQLRRKSALDPDYSDGDELWYIKRTIERLVDEVEWLMRRQPVDQHLALLCLLGRLFRMLWAERGTQTPERLKAAFAHFVDLQQAEEQRAGPRPRRTLGHHLGPGGLAISPWPPEDPRGGYGGSISDLELLLPNLQRWLPRAPKRSHRTTGDTTTNKEVTT